MIYWVWSFTQPEPVPGLLKAFDPLMIQVLNIGIYMSLSFPYYVIGHMKYGTTFAKRLFRIYVVNQGDLGALTMRQSIVRYLAYFVSALPLGAGYTMAGFHPEKRALHDLIAGTSCIRR